MFSSWFPMPYLPMRLVPVRPVQAGIKASKADSKAVGEIVEAAITASNSMANTIVECAPLWRLTPLDEIEAAFARVMKDGKSYSTTPVQLGGTFLVTPTAPASPPSKEEVKTIIRVTTSTVRINSPNPSP